MAIRVKNHEIRSGHDRANKGRGVAEVELTGTRDVNVAGRLVRAGIPRIRRIFLRLSLRVSTRLLKPGFLQWWTIPYVIYITDYRLVSERYTCEQVFSLRVVSILTILTVMNCHQFMKYVKL